MGDKEKETVTASEVGKLEEVLKPATVTKKEVEDDIRLIKRTCRGNFLLTIEERNKLHDRWFDGNDEDRKLLLAELVTMHKKRPNVRGKFMDELAAAQKTPEQIRELALVLIHGFPDNIGLGRCGQDVNELIIADGKYDGEDHHVKCPKCGHVHTYSKLANIAG